MPFDAAALNLRAQSRWSTCDVNKKFLDTGFTLVNPTQETLGAIQAIIDELQFPGPADSPEEDRPLALSQVVTRPGCSLASELIARCSAATARATHSQTAGIKPRNQLQK